MPVIATDPAWALRTARREARDRDAPQLWTDADWMDELNATSFGDPYQPYYDPYLAAVGFITDQNSLATRVVGGVTERFVDTQKMVNHLHDMSQRHRALNGGSPGIILTSWGP